MLSFELRGNFGSGVQGLGFMACRDSIDTKRVVPEADAATWSFFFASYAAPWPASSRHAAFFGRAMALFDPGILGIALEGVEGCCLTLIIST